MPEAGHFDTESNLKIIRKSIRKASIIKHPIYH